jgi:hypothetical protein
MAVAGQVDGVRLVDIAVLALEEVGRVGVVLDQSDLLDDSSAIGRRGVFGLAGVELPRVQVVVEEILLGTLDGGVDDVGGGDDRLLAGAGNLKDATQISFPTRLTARERERARDGDDQRTSSGPRYLNWVSWLMKTTPFPWE